MQFTSTARGARSARRTTVRHLQEWGFPPAADVSCTVGLVVAELAANAVRHGRVRGRGFLLSVIYEANARHIRVEVSDASPELPPAAPAGPADDEESGRGLILVGVLAARWGAHPRTPEGKTVWAECPVGAPVRTRETADQVRAGGGEVVAVGASPGD
ncbi:ATP-binding protein [Streptomyces sp. NPDC020403]